MKKALFVIVSLMILTLIWHFTHGYERLWVVAWIAMWTFGVPATWIGMAIIRPKEYKPWFWGIRTQREEFLNVLVYGPARLLLPFPRGQSAEPTSTAPLL